MRTSKLPALLSAASLVSFAFAFACGGGGDDASTPGGAGPAAGSGGASAGSGGTAGKGGASVAGSGGASTGGTGGSPVAGAGGAGGGLVAGAGGGSVAGAAGAGTLTISAAPMARVVPGASVDVPVTLGAIGTSGDIVVEVLGLPAEVSAAKATFPQGTTKGNVTLSATAAATLTSRKTASLKATAGGASASAALDVVVVGAPGTLDASFGTGGKVVTNLSPSKDEMPTALLREPNGSLVVVVNTGAAEVVVAARFHASGEPDPTFSSFGGSGFCFGGAARARKDGSFAYGIVAGGVASVRFAGNDGKQSAAPLSFDAATLGASASHLLLPSGPDDMLYAVVSAGNTVKIARITAANTIDTSYATAGWATIPAILPYAAAVDAAGGLVVAGGANSDRSAVRLTPSGALDTAFSGDGRLTVAGVDTESFQDAAVLPDGRVVLGAYGLPSAGGLLGIEVKLPSGEPDVAFGTDGTAPSQVYPLRLGLFGADLLAVGGTNQLFSTAFRASRLSATTGAPPASFGKDGVVDVNFGEPYATAGAFVVDDIGRLTMAGGTKPAGGQFKTALARLWL